MSVLTVSRAELEGLTLEKLRKMARELEISGRSKLKKAQLIEAIAATSEPSEPEPSEPEPSEPAPFEPDPCESPIVLMYDDSDELAVSEPELRAASVPLAALFLLPVHSRRLFAFWECEAAAARGTKQRCVDADAVLVLRVRDVSLIEFDERRDLGRFDIAITSLSDSSYLDDLVPGRSYQAEIGYRAADGTFERVVASSAVEMPPDRPRRTIDPEVRRVNGSGEEHDSEAADEFSKRASHFVERAGRFDSQAHDDDRVAAAASTPSSVFDTTPFTSVSSLESAAAETRGAVELVSSLELQRRSSGDLGAVAVSSLGLSPLVEGLPAAQDVELAEGEGLRLELGADLIVYGRTQPDTRVVIDGVEVPVRSDGTFDVRFALNHVRR